jgi:hypothetical protein
LPRQRVHIRTVGHVLQELSRQYRLADSGKLAWQDCAAAGRVLREIRATIEGSEVEQRLDKLEALLAEHRGARSPARPNGHGRPEVRT